MADHAHARQAVDQLRAHAKANFGTGLGNIAGNSADIIEGLLRELDKGN